MNTEEVITGMAAGIKPAVMGSDIGVKTLENKKDPKEHQKKFYSTLVGIPTGVAATLATRRKSSEWAAKAARKYIAQQKPGRAVLSLLGIGIGVPTAAGMAAGFGGSYLASKLQQRMDKGMKKESGLKDVLKSKKLLLGLGGAGIGGTLGYISDPIDEDTLRPLNLSDKEKKYYKLKNALTKGSLLGGTGYFLGKYLDDAKKFGGWRNYRGAWGGAGSASSRTSQTAKDAAKKFRDQGMSAKEFAKKYHPDKWGNLDEATKAARVKEMGGDQSSFADIFNELKKNAFYLGYTSNVLDKFKW